MLRFVRCVWVACLLHAGDMREWRRDDAVQQPFCFCFHTKIARLGRRKACGMMLPPQLLARAAHCLYRGTYALGLFPPFLHVVLSSLMPGRISTTAVRMLPFSSLSPQARPAFLRYAASANLPLVFVLCVSLHFFAGEEGAGGCRKNKPNIGTSGAATTTPRLHKPCACVCVCVSMCLAA